MSSSDILVVVAVGYLVVGLLVTFIAALAPDGAEPGLATLLAWPLLLLRSLLALILTVIRKDDHEP